MTIYGGGLRLAQHLSFSTPQICVDPKIEKALLSSSDVPGQRLPRAVNMGRRVGEGFYQPMRRRQSSKTSQKGRS